MHVHSETRRCDTILPSLVHHAVLLFRGFLMQPLLSLLHSALSTNAPALNNAAGYCAEAPPPQPTNFHPIAARISRFPLTLPSWTVTKVKFSIYGASAMNTISPFTQRHHQIFLFCRCSSTRMHLGVITFFYTCLCGCIDLLQLAHLQRETKPAWYPHGWSKVKIWKAFIVLQTYACIQ